MKNKVRFFLSVLPFFLLSGILLKAQRNAEYCSLGSDVYNDPETVLREENQKFRENTTNKNNKALSINLYNIGFVHYFIGNYDSSIYYCEAAITLCEKSGDSRTKAFVWSLEGLVLAIKDLKGQALPLQLKALKLFEIGSDSLGIGMVLKDIPYSIPSIGPQKTREYLFKALDLYVKKRNASLAGIVMNNIGDTYLQENRTDSASYFFTQVLQLAGIGKNKYLAALANNNLGNTLYLKKEKNKAPALQYYLRALTLYQELRSPRIKNAYFSLGQFYIESGDFSNAKKYLDSLIANAERTNSEVFLKDGYAKLSELYEQHGDFKKALEYHKLFSLRNDSLLLKENSLQMTELEAKYQNAKRQKKIESLSQQNKIQQLQVKQDQYFIWGAIALIILILIITFLLIRQNKVNSLHTRIELEKKLFYSNMRALRSQMNPHFIFNSLNSIQGLVNINENKKASDFISKFSKLTRSILQNSESTKLSLEDEIEFLKVYMDIQAMRMDENFVYSIEVDKTIDMTDTQIPSFIIQPFLENAFVHGLFHKEGEKKLKVFVTCEKGCLIWIIEDNGVGFKKSEEVNSRNAKHQSTGIKNAQERLYFVTGEGEKGSILYEHLSDGENAVGTRVIIKMPVL